MFHNYFFLKRLAKELDSKLKGLELVQCFSQNKEELILGFASAESECWIRANLNPAISLLGFPDSIRRASKNSVDLFQDLSGQKVVTAKAFDFERSFEISFEDNQSLIFKMHGRKSNILRSSGDKVVEIFRNNLQADLDIVPADLNKKIEVDIKAFEAAQHEPSSLIPALGKEIGAYWEKSFSTLADEKKWEAFTSLLEQLDRNPIQMRAEPKPQISLLMLEGGGSTQDPIEAANWLYQETAKEIFVEQEKGQLVRELKKQISRSENYIFKTSEKLRQSKAKRNPEEIANIIMANLNLLKMGLEEATLNDFYTNEFIQIKLNPKLSPQKNAENLYRKSKNRHQEIDKLEKNISDKEKLIEKLQQQLSKVESLDSARDLKKYMKDTGVGNKKKSEENLPYHEILFDGWVILVGKNAKANDQLTFKVAKKNDLWLHAKDVSGSHVVVKQKPGHNYPKHIIEKAASLAAFNSKRKTDTLCPVIYTAKKYIRKMKGTPAGQVIVEKEEVLLIEPASSEDL